eukprot:5886225-Pleurochrysis_carterae.AAC.1
MGEQLVTKVEGRKLVHAAQREERIHIVVCGFRLERLTLGRTILKLVVVNPHCLAPRLQVANRGIGPYVDKRNESLD